MGGFDSSPSYVTNPRVNWHSNNPNVIRIDISAHDYSIRMDAVGSGEAIVTAEVDGIICTIKFIVWGWATQLSIGGRPTNAAGQVTDHLKADTAYDKLHTVTNGNINWVYWESSEPSVATIDPTTGDIYTKKVTQSATTIIKVKIKVNSIFLHDQFTLTVDPVSVTSVSIGNKPSGALTVGETQPLNAVVLPDNASNKAVTWSSNNASVATVNGSGLLTAVCPGTAIITATAGGQSSSFKVVVPSICLSGKDVVFYNSDKTSYTFKYISKEEYSRFENAMKNLEKTTYVAFYLLLKPNAISNCKGNDKLNLTAQQVEFLEFYDPWGAKLYLTAKDNKDLTRNVFKLLEHRNPMYYRWFDGDWQEEHDANTYDYTEAEAYLTYSISPLNLSEVVIVGFLVVSVTAVAVEAIPALIAGVSKYGYSTALGLQSVGLLNEELPVLEEASEAELALDQQIVEKELEKLGTAETQAEVNVIKTEISVAIKGVSEAESLAIQYGGRNIVGTTFNQLKPTQEYVNMEKVQYYVNKLEAGETVAPIEVYEVSGKGWFIEEGHHRYIASQLTGKPVQMIYKTTSGPIGMSDWADVLWKAFSEEGDW